MSYTPMMNQYLEIKGQYKDAILFFRLGDFYEMFFEDAVTASSVLEITLTGREAGQPNKIPMCGIPYHAAETYIAKLIQKGFKVAICEQVEDPSQAKGIVRREVVRVITPGTILENEFLNEKVHNYLVSISYFEDTYGLAVADISTGLFQCTHFFGTSGFSLLMDELVRLKPAEVIAPPSLPGLASIHDLMHPVNITSYPDFYFTLQKSMPKLTEVLGSAWQEVLKTSPQAVTASGSLLWYLEETQKKDPGQIKSLSFYTHSQYLLIDRSTRKNLELTNSLRDNGRWGTLIWVLDRTKTSMGARLIRNWIDQPLTDPDEINQRLDGVEELASNILMRHDLKTLLTPIYDLERLTTKAIFGTANARDLLALRNSLEELPNLKEMTKTLQSSLLHQAANEIDTLSDLHHLLANSISDDPPITVRDGRIIRDGYDPEVDRLRKVQNEGKSWLAKLESEEQENTGIKSLKIGYNKVFGYYLEVTKSNYNLVPDYFIRKQTLANAERYITPKLKELEELILSAGDRLVQLEYNLFNEIRERVASASERIQKTSQAIAKLDVILSLAETAVEENYIRPRILKNHEIHIVEGRHPVVEKVIGSENFVPNDTLLDTRNHVILLTGPNMAGKSTYMRQVALLVLLAQMGSFIPAQEAHIGIVDKIFTRIGAADDLAGGLSTFMVEMMECKNIVDGATEKSLVIMDEVGRGTSTYDGISIARALVEHIVTHIRSRTLFSTHYHELTDLESLQGVKNYTMTVKEKDHNIIFLRKVIPGKADRSYGIHVAALAGLPVSVVEKAKEILAGLESCKAGFEESAVSFENSFVQGRLDMEQNTESPISLELKRIDISKMTPLEALNMLAKLQGMLN